MHVWRIVTAVLGVRASWSYTLILLRLRRRRARSGSCTLDRGRQRHKVPAPHISKLRCHCWTLPPRSTRMNSALSLTPNNQQGEILTTRSSDITAAFYRDIRRLKSMHVRVRLGCVAIVSGFVSLGDPLEVDAEVSLGPTWRYEVNILGKSLVYISGRKG